MARWLNRKTFLLAALVLGVFLLFRFLPSPLAPTLTATTPLPQSTNVPLLPTVKLQFDLPISPSDVTLLATPPIEFRLVAATDQVLSFSPTAPLSPLTRYTLTITTPNPEPFTLIFTTMATQTDSALLDRLHTKLADQYPLAKQTPYTTTLYRVTYSAPLTLKITVTDPSLSDQQAIAQVQAWVKAHQLDPSSHQYAVVKTPPTR